MSWATFIFRYDFNGNRRSKKLCFREDAGGCRLNPRKSGRADRTARVAELLPHGAWPETCTCARPPSPLCVWDWALRWPFSSTGGSPLLSGKKREEKNSGFLQKGRWVAILRRPWRLDLGPFRGHYKGMKDGSVVAEERFSPWDQGRFLRQADSLNLESLLHCRRF